MSRRSRQASDPVEPDLPITPMLDMSFQLLAFFVMTFRPAPTEGQIAMTLPKQEGGGITMPSPADEKPVRYVVRVNATEKGAIAGITLTEAESAKAPTDLKADTRLLLDELKKLFEQNKGKAKLTIEIEPKLLQEHVVALLDAAFQAGFSEIAPVPVNPDDR